ncbi:hypothetical protein N9P79_02550 [Crocinitomicaceae bacterium]|nr:hypothetical protein [Crocinitomicaceae bacterium]MDC0100111.1 hypothetical protein [Crocinitomicaceae bacterium]
MSTDFYKTPSFIGAAVIVFSFFLSFVSVGNSDSLKLSVSGMQLTINSGSISGDKVKRMKERDNWSERKAKILEKVYDSDDSFGVLDKLSVLLILGAGLIIFGAYKASKGESFFLDGDKLKYLKYGLVAIAAFLFLRYNFEIGINLNEQAKIGIGLWLCLLASIFLVFEPMIMEKLKGLSNNGSSTPDEGGDNINLGGRNA